MQETKASSGSGVDPGSVSEGSNSPSDTNGADPGPSSVTCSRCGEVAVEGANQCSSCGCFVAGNAANLRHGLRRYQTTNVLPPELETFMLEYRGQILADLGGEDSLSRVGLAMVDRLCELEAVARLQLDFGLRCSADVKRGRAVLSDYRATVDTQMRVARLLDAAVPEVTDLPQWGNHHG